MAEETGTAPETGTDDAELSAIWESDQKGTATEEIKSQESQEGANEKSDEVAAEKTDSPEKQADEVKSPDEKKDEKQKHKERSDLGRKLKDATGEIEALKQQVAQLIEAQKGTKAIAATGPQDDDVPEVIATADDVRRVQAADRQKEQIARMQYQNSYISTIGEISKSEDLRDEIWSEMTANNFNNQFNSIHTGNPAADAQINYANAKAYVLKKQLESAGVKLPERKTSDRPPIQPAAVTTTTKAKSAVLPKLDPATEEYVKHLRRTGVPEDEIASYLS